jgi:predicted ATPase
LTSSDEAHIARCIDDLMLPWKVDLILDHRLQHQAMRDNIDREGVIFYQREAPDRS